MLCCYKTLSNGVLCCVVIGLVMKAIVVLCGDRPGDEGVLCYVVVGLVTKAIVEAVLL